MGFRLYLLDWTFAAFFRHREIYPFAPDKESWLSSTIFNYSSPEDYKRKLKLTGPIPDLSPTNFASSLAMLDCLVGFALDFLQSRCPEAPGEIPFMFDLYLSGKLGFKISGAGKTRIFTIPNGLKQALLRPAHDWCMDVLRGIPMDGTLDQSKPISRLVGRCMHLFSFDLSAATDRFPLVFQSLIIEKLFNQAIHRAWISGGLLMNVFQAPSQTKGYPMYMRFHTGQPLGLLSFLSEPLFALSHHFLVWHAADLVYPYRVFKDYALLGDDIVIGDEKVAAMYESLIRDMHVKISKSKSLISHTGFLEFAKRFVGPNRDFSPILARMIRSIYHSVALIPVMTKIGSRSLRLSLRLRGAGYRRYNGNENHHCIKSSRFWYRHCMIMCSPIGINRLPFEFWLFHPKPCVADCYSLGLVWCGMLS